MLDPDNTILKEKGRSVHKDAILPTNNERGILYEAQGFVISVIFLMFCIGIYTLSAAETPATSLSGAKDLSVQVGDTICIKKSDFHLYPEDSLINGQASYQDAGFYLYAYNYLFVGNSEFYEEFTDDGDVLTYITPNTPGYYPVYAYSYYDDEDTGESFSVQSNYFKY